MIGQNKLKQEIDTLINSNSFPRVFSVIGRSGFGKSTLIKYICNKLCIDDIIEATNIDDIRDTIVSAPNFTHTCLLHVCSFENMNFRAVETLLKLCEDVPKNLYITFEVTNTALCEDRFLNRSYVFELSPYSKSELIEIIRCIKEDVTDNEITEMLSMVGSPKEFEQLLAYGVTDAKTFIDKVINNVCSAHISNAMKIFDSLSSKADDNKLPMLVFFNAVKNCAFRNYLKTANADMLNLFKSATTAYEDLILNPKANKRALFDKFIISLSEV